jgi:uncharacterized protein YeeX (DUF496 family)
MPMKRTRRKIIPRNPRHKAKKIRQNPQNYVQIVNLSDYLFHFTKICGINIEVYFAKVCPPGF